MARVVVCPDCKGEGKILTPSLRNVAFTSEDFEQDPDFKEQMLGGYYDVECPTCKGRNVITIDERKKYYDNEEGSLERESGY